MISENKRTNNVMDWNIRPPPDSSLQATNFEFQGPHLEQQFPTAGGFSQDPTSTQKPCTYPGNNQIINIPSSTVIANKLPLQSTGGSSSLQPFHPKTSKTNNGFGPPKHLRSMPPVSLSAVFVQMAPSVTQNSNLMKNVHTSSYVVLQGSTVNPVQNIPQKRVNPYMARENYNNQSQQVCSNSVRTSVYPQAYKNNLSPKSQSTLVPYCYVNGPPISQADATVPLNSLPNHYLSSQQNLTYAVHPVGQNNQNQINGQNASMTVTAQSPQYVSAHINHTPYSVPTHGHNRNATQISLYTVPTQVKPPPYPMPSVQTNYGQFSLPQPVANIPNENVQNYHNPMPELNTTSYSAHYGQKGLSAQIFRDTNAVDSIAYNINERGFENQCSNESTKSSIEFRESLNSVQAAQIVSADEALTPQTSQTLQSQKNPSNVTGNFPDNSPKDKLKITKESLALDYKKIHEIELALLKLGEAFKRKCKMFLSAEKNKQVSDLSTHNLNQNLNQSCNATQNKPSHDASPALQFPSHDASQNHNASQTLQFPSKDASQNQSFSASCDSNQDKDVPSLPQKADPHLLPILRSLLEGTADENMVLDAFFANKVTDQNRRLAVSGSSSSSLSVSSGDKSEYNVNNTVSTPRPSPQMSRMNSTQEPLPSTKNDLSLMHTSKSVNHQLEKITAASSGHLLYHFRLNRGALETLRHYFNQSNQSSVQSPTDSPEFFLSRNKAIKESSENSNNSLSACPILMQKPEKNIKTENGYVSDASSSASVLSERVVVGQEAGTVQNPNPTISADSFRNEGICSLEELKTSLALWTKSLPPSLSGQLCESTQSTVSLFSSEKGKGDKMPQQSLENLINTLNQNDQAKDSSGSDQITQSSVPISLGKNHDPINSSLSKGCEPQVAIVTPLMLSKDNVQMAVQKNSPCLEITSPISVKGRVHSLEKSLSTILHSDKGIHSNSSPSESVKYCKDLDLDQKTVISTQENGIVKAEIGGNCYELSQVVGSRTLELKDLKSQVGPGPNLPLENEISQECSLSQTGSDLLEPRNADKVLQNDSTLQISSVCTLVEGDAFYNSQIASIFGTSPLKSNMESDSSLKDLAPHLQCNDQQSGILKTEPESEISGSVTEENAELPLPCTLTKAVQEAFKVTGLEISQSHKTSDEMNERNSEIKNSLLPEGMPLSEKKLEQKVSCNGVYSTDFVSDDQKLCQNKGGQLNSSSADGLCAINKEGVSAEDNQKHSGSSTEAPVILLNDQLTELSKEFPYGIGYLKTLNITENNVPVPKHNDRRHKENTHISEKSPDPPDAIDQIKVKILSSQQIKEVFPEHTQQFSIKSENSKDCYFRTNSEDNLTRESMGLIKTDKAIDVEARTTSSETTLKRGERTYCCLHGWLASGYAVPPCSCMRIKESGSNQKVDLCSQSETMIKDRPKASGNCNVDFQLTSQLPTSTLDKVTKKVSSGTQSDRTLNKISGHTDTNEHKPHRVDQAASPLLSLEKLNLQKPKQANEHIRKELSHHASSQSIKTEMEAVEIDLTHDHVQAREKLSTEEAQYLSNTEDVVVARSVCRSDSSSKQRTEKIVVKSKTNTPQHKCIEIKCSINYERYKIKRDSSETHMIRGPTLSKGLKRQKAVEGKHKVLGVQHNDAVNASDLANVSSFSKKCGNPEYISTAHSQNHLNGKKFGKIDLEKHYGYKKVEHKETTYSECSKHHSEHAEHHSEHTKPVIKRINLEKYAYSKDRKNTWKCRSSHLNNSKTLTPQKLRVRPPNISKMLSPGKEAMLDVNKKEKWSERSLSDKKSCFNRRTSKLSISLQREPKKTYLNRVAFRRTAHKTICLTNLEPSHSKSVWHVKSSSLSEWSKDKRKSSSPPRQPEAENPPMLEFKMCPDILFRNPVTEEQISDAKKLPEKDTVPVTAVKSKREDWLNYDPVKRRKTEEKEAQADDEIPLDTAIKLLDRNDMLGTPLKDSQTTFETYRKMHLEKRSRSLDSSPLN